MANIMRVNTSNLMRGAGRLLYAPTSTLKPTKISDVIKLTASPVMAVQTLTISGTPTGGTFTVGYGGESVTVAYNVSAANLQTALNGLTSIVNAGGVTVGLAGAVYTVTFIVEGARPTFIVSHALTGGTTPSIAAATTVAGVAVYDPQAGWYDLGSTREGIQVTVNNAEDAFDIDQIAGDIGAAPSSWECGIATRLAEMSLETFQFIWEGSAITVDATNGEREIGFAGAASYTQRRLAVIFMKPNGKLRGFFFHKVVRTPQEGTIDMRKGGDAMTLQMNFKALADESVTDPLKQFFIVRDQI